MRQFERCIHGRREKADLDREKQKDRERQLDITQLKPKMNLHFKITGINLIIHLIKSFGYLLQKPQEKTLFFA